MANTVFTDDTQAQKALTVLNFMGKDKKYATGKLEADDIKGYAKIAALLCNDALFLRHLENVSKNLWIEYCKFDAYDRNKFSRAINTVAMRAGFSVQSHTNGTVHPTEIVLVGGKDPDFLEFVRKKVFWKDSMDGRHGEWSHALQWLAIADSAVVPNVTELYTKTVNYGTKNADGGDVTLWSWLVDCFPEDMKGASEVLRDGKQTLGSNSFRAPQYLMDYLVRDYHVHKLEKHFIATYLYCRYRNRNWLTDPGNGASMDIRQGHLPTHGNRKHGDTAQWTPVIAEKQVQGYRRQGTYNDKNTDAKEERTFKFHNQEGNVYANFTFW